MSENTTASRIGPASTDGSEVRADVLRIRDERLQGLKTLAGRMAHDFKNLLVPGVGYGALLKDGLGEESPLFSYVEKLQKCNENADSFLERILLAVRPQRSFRPCRTDLASLLEETLRDWHSRLSPGPAIQVETSFVACTLYFDEGQLRKLFLHLLDNSRLALPKGGTIRVVLKRWVLDLNQVKALGLEGTDGFQFQIRDNGVGMSSDILARACEPFFSTRPKNTNPGLALISA